MSGERLLSRVRAVLSERWNSLWFRKVHRERLVARKESEALFALLQTVKAQHPDLTGAALYVKVVSERIRCDEKEAKKIVRAAERDFAQWPVYRDVEFRDVVKHLIVAQLIEANGGVVDSNWNFDDIVAKFIPSGL